MMTSKRIYFISIVIIVLLLIFWSCKKSNPLDPVLYDYGEVNDTTLVLAGAIIIDNPFGATTIMGDVTETSILLNRHKLVKAENSRIAESYYPKMSFTVMRNGDTIYISTTAPEETKDVKPFTNIGITMPAAVRPVVKNARNNVTLYYVSSTCLIENAHSNITLIEHDGSCDVHTTNGKISIETIIPTTGFCRATSGSGDIILNIPLYTSARVDAMTKNGSVTVSPDLSFISEQNDGNVLTGTLLDGSAEIYLRTNAGNINLIGFN